MNRYKKRTIIFLAFLCIFTAFSLRERPPLVIECEQPHITESEIEKIVSECISEFYSDITKPNMPLEADLEIESEIPSYPEEDIQYLAQLTIAEAGNQTVLGKRLVIDTVLNRVEHEKFPNTIREVIDQTNQFSPVSSGSIYRYSATDEIISLIHEEIERRTEPDVIFFRAGEYGPYGVPMYKVGGHYFSSYD